MMIEFPPREAFEAWLRAKPPKTVIAKNWGCTDCPLANWLRKTRKFNRAYISDIGYYDDVILPNDDLGEKLQPLPSWAFDFVDKVDDLNEESAGVADCLAILGSIPRG